MEKKDQKERKYSDLVQKETLEKVEMIEEKGRSAVYKLDGMYHHVTVIGPEEAPRIILMRSSKNKKDLLPVK